MKGEELPPRTQGLSSVQPPAGGLIFTAAEPAEILLSGVFCPYLEWGGDCPEGAPRASSKCWDPLTGFPPWDPWVRRED